MVQTLQQEIENLMKEVRALKVTATVPSMFKCYTWGPQIPPALEIEITYGDGEQPIVSEFYTGSTVMPEQPSGNTQRVHMYSQYQYELFIASTRPIESIRAV